MGAIRSREYPTQVLLLALISRKFLEPRPLASRTVLQLRRIHAERKSIMMFTERNLRGFAVIGLAAMLVLSGCATTVESKPEAVKAVESGGSLPPDVTSFFGDNAVRLEPGPSGGAALAYVNQGSTWVNYNSIQLMPVEFWASADSKVSPQDQQMLTAYFYNKLKEVLSKNYKIVDQPGDNTLKLRVALM